MKRPRSRRPRVAPQLRLNITLGYIYFKEKRIEIISQTIDSISPNDKLNFLCVLFTSMTCICFMKLLQGRYSTLTHKDIV